MVNRLAFPFAPVLAAFALAAVAITGCGGVDTTVPEPTAGSDAGGSVGTGGSGNDATGHLDGGVIDGGPDLAGTGTGSASCDQKQSTASLGINANGHHNAGMNCGTCHAAGKLTWTVAGTLYNAAGGTTGVAGATIHVTDAKGTSITMVTANNGNFWTPTALTPPFKLSASSCPNTAAMSNTATGFCNQCHGAGFRVHLP
jgi:hypothetical protein